MQELHHGGGISRRHALQIMGGAGAAALLAACGASGSKPSGGAGGNGGAKNLLLPKVPESLIEAAQKEGQVNLWSSVVQGNYDAYNKSDFEKAYPGVKVNVYSTATSSVRDTRFQNEFKAGVAKVDIMLGGASGPNAEEKPAGMLQPVSSYLLPEVIDTSNWMFNELKWTDTEHEYFLLGDMTFQPQLALNKDVDPGSVQEWKDLLDPKWKGQIVMSDPRESGLGFAVGMIMYCHPKLGPDFVKDLFGSGNVVFNNDVRQMIEWVDKGEKKMALEPTYQQVESLRKIGEKIPFVNTLAVDGTKVGGYFGSSGIAFLPNLKPLPHPNATKLYLNWHYSRAGAQSLIDNVGTLSARTDVDSSKLADYLKPEEGADYINASESATGENVGKMRAAVSAALK